MQGGGPRGGGRGEGGARVKSVTWKSAMEAGVTVGEEMGSRGHLRCARAGALQPQLHARAGAPPPLPACAGLRCTATAASVRGPAMHRRRCQRWPDLWENKREVCRLQVRSPPGAQGRLWLKARAIAATSLLAVEPQELPVRRRRHRHGGRRLSFDGWSVGTAGGFEIFFSLQQ